LADLAIVKPLQKGKFKRVLFGSNTNTRPGDFVVAIGCPLGLQNTITAGVVSALQRDSNEIGRKDNRVQYIQTDLVVHSGSSGGPLVNMDGRVIGINTTRAESEGISFAIRVDTAMEMIKMLQVKGKITRPFLGIHTKSLNPSFFSQLNEETKHQILPGTVGVLVTKVQKFTPAEKSGFLEGDIITKVHGEKGND
jgi:S1-C subfamily serine protease